MKKIQTWMIAAILTCGFGTMLASCSDNDSETQQKMTPLSDADMESLRQAVIGDGLIRRTSNCWAILKPMPSMSTAMLSVNIIFLSIMTI